MANPAAPLSTAELEAIFQPFQRANATQAEGFGLGLALVKKIVEAHGGAVSAAATRPRT